MGGCGERLARSLSRTPCQPACARSIPRRNKSRQSSHLNSQQKRPRPSSGRERTLPWYHPCCRWAVIGMTACKPLCANGYSAIGCPSNAGPAGRSTFHQDGFNRQLRSELFQVPSGRGFQSTASFPCRLSPEYFSPSQPLQVALCRKVCRLSNDPRSVIIASARPSNT